MANIDQAVADQLAAEAAGRHRRDDVANDRALCQYRDDAEALFGTWYYGNHGGPVAMPGNGSAMISAMNRTGRAGRLLLSGQLNGRRY